MAHEIATYSPVDVPVDQSATAVIFKRATMNRDSRGNMILARPLTQTERNTIGNRLRAIAPVMQPAPKSKIEDVILEMWTAFDFGGWLSNDERNVTIAKYTEVLGDLPLFAIKRAAQRFERMEVKAEELNATRDFNPSRPPNATQLRLIAMEVMRPIQDETIKGRMLLKAAVDQEQNLSADEIERRREHVNRVKAELKVMTDKWSLEDELMRREKAERARLNSDKRLLDEYAAAGLEPIYCDSAKTILQSLSGLLHAGWTIEAAEDRKPQLVSPTGARQIA